MRAYVIERGRVLAPEGLIEAALRVEDGVIVEIGAGDVAREGARVVDAQGLIVAPAAIDIHGDAFERQVMPRPDVFFPMDVAVLDTDRQLAGCGIATAYHALTLSWEPGLRSVARGAAFVEALTETAARQTVDHRLQLRWETFAFEAMPLIERALEEAATTGRTPSVAFNDHTSMMLRDFDISVVDRPFEQSPAFRTAAFDDPRLVGRIKGQGRRAGLSEEDYLALLREVWARRPEVDDAIRRVASWARAAGAPMLSHDDTQLETRAYYQALGATIAEFPMREEVARAASETGGGVVLGAPNVMRGGSHIGSLSAADMVEAGLCDILASDYAYPAMLAAAGRLLAERRADLPTIWATLSRNPARALGLADRGEIAPGKRADLVLLEWPEQGAPVSRMTMSAGRIAYLGADLL